jgi:hypothetical protein
MSDVEDEYTGHLSTSGSSLAYRANVMRVFSQFRGSTPARAARYPADFEALPLATAIHPGTYVEFSEYLRSEYRARSGRGAGKPLCFSTALGYLCCLLRTSSSLHRHTGGLKAKLFFTCLDSPSSTEAALWLKGLKRCMQRDMFERAKKEGAVMDHSATPLYIEHLRLMAEALAWEGSAESALRKAVLVTAHLSAGHQGQVGA